MALGPNQEKWLEALESGQFSQGRGSLNFGGSFCCLGVACEVFKTEAVEIDTDCDDGVRYNGNWETAPNFVIDALALRDDLGTPKDGDTDKRLINLNDGGEPFKAIAALIRQDPASYFEKER